ncbi:hypothetical protein [Neorhizobium sp. DAR64872/K0K18]|uniref:hypothetical protein n=1 Tax=Neorhizobium sp. DAR64872/K0K18 TaxID=3421958 RepID=UPI003D26E66E
MDYIPPYGSTDPDAPYVDRSTATAVRGSPLAAAFFNDIQAELLAVIVAAGLEPSETDLAQIAQAIQSGQLSYSVAAGTGNALTATLKPAPSTLREGMRILLKAEADNTGAMSINVNGLGVVAIKRADGSDTKAGDAVAGQYLPLVYAGTVWVLDKATGYLPLVGGVMTGPITLPGPPTEEMHAVPRSYVDHPGYVAVSSAVTLTVAQLRKYVEVLGSGSFTIGLPAPSAASTTGGMYFICNVGSSDKTLSTPSGNFIGPNGTNASTMTLPRGAFVWVICGFDNWIVVQQTYSFKLVQSAEVLTPSALGGYIQLGGSSTFQVTLPNPSSFSGAALEIYNSGSVAYTLRTPAGSFLGPKGTAAPTVNIGPGEYFMFRAGTGNWIVH